MPLFSINRVINQYPFYFSSLQVQSYKANQRIIIIKNNKETVPILLLSLFLSEIRCHNTKLIV